MSTANKKAPIKSALVIDSKDNIAVALEDLKKGERIQIRMSDRKFELTVQENIPFGHKLTLRELKKNDPVYKYGEEIGRMVDSIELGRWVHLHNLYCDRGNKYER